MADNATLNLSTYLTPIHERAGSAIEDGHSENGAGWSRSVAEQLEHLRDSAQELEADGLVAPSTLVIELAMDWAETLARRGCPAPTRVVPDGDGGVVFEWDAAGLYQSITITPEHKLELCVFVDAELVHRESHQL